MKKKVCLITYSHSPNYGAALQLFATYKMLEKLGCEVRVLDYQNKFESEKDKFGFWFSNASLKEKARVFISSYIFGVKKNAVYNFNKFYDSLEYTDIIHSVVELSTMSEFDAFCVGSDQVWNPSITNGFDDVFILNTKLPRKISYASSMGSLKFDGYDEDKLVSSLMTFDSVSVRERSSYDYLNNHFSGKYVTQVVDPTFLFGMKNWDECLERNNINPMIKEKYVLIYALGGYLEQSNKIAHDIANRIGAKVALITLSNRYKDVDYLLTKVTPLDFVSLVKNASFVVVNSFHGTCFSLIYGTPFYSVRFGDNPARSEELLGKYGLTSRLFKNGDEISNDALNDKDIICAQERLQLDADKSVLWLNGAIYGEKQSASI